VKKMAGNLSNDSSKSDAAYFIKKLGEAVKKKAPKKAAVRPAKAIWGNAKKELRKYRHRVAVGKIPSTTARSKAPKVEKMNRKIAKVRSRIPKAVRVARARKIIDIDD
jgi:hypothetical protein